MTHGCLKIVAFDDQRPVMLHTTHTGMDIPKAVDDAVGVLAKRRSYQADYLRGKADAELLASCLDNFQSNAVTCQLGYQPSVAALIIAGWPDFLVPIDGFEKDLPRWSGYDHPYTLTISEGRWELKDEGGNVIRDFDPTQKLAELFVAMAKKAKAR